MMVGGAVTGALSMGLGATSQAPHGGIFVFFAIGNLWAFVLSIVVGAIVGAFMVTLLKELGERRQSSPEPAAEAVVESSGAAVQPAGASSTV
jgi:PTS system fructose-specific IIC component